MANDVLGELDVVIGADWSDLQSAIDDAVSAAQAGAQAIQDAFTDTGTFTGAADNLASLTAALGTTGDAAESASGQLSLFGDSTSQASDQLSLFDQNSIDAADSMAQVGDAANTAATGLEDVGAGASNAAEGITEAGGAAEEAETGLAGIVEQLTLLGEALAITEGLKEFGEEALNATSTIQSVTVGLTALTGSAEEADSIIEDIKNLAATQPFAFPEIAPTVQKMVALGVSAEAIPGVLQSVADAASATTNSFAAVANSFDRITLSGTANARTLATLGVSFQMLSGALTDAGIAAGDTNKEISAAFAGLPDQATRISVLQDAISKFAGTSVAEAQTIGGQWQIFQNQFEEVMVSVGEALAPVVGDILNAFTNTILPTIKEAVDAFNSLPGPVKDVVVVIGLAAAAVVPLTAGLAALGLAVIGLQGAIPALTGVMTALGVASTETAAAEVAVGTAAVTTTAEVTAEGVAMAEAATATTTAASAAGLAVTAFGALAAIFGGWIIGTWLGGMQDASQQLQAMTGFAHSLGINLDQAGASGNDLSSAITKLQGIAAYNNITIEQGSMSTQQYALALLTALKNAAQASTGIQQIGTAAAGTDTAVAALASKVSGLNGALIKAQTTLAIVKENQDGTAASAQLLQAAQEAVTKAQTALDSEVSGKAVPALQGYKQAMADMALKTVPTFADSVDAAATKIIAAQNKEDSQLIIDMGVWQQLSSSATASTSEISAAWAKVQTDLKNHAGSDEATLSITDLAAELNNFGTATGSFGAVIENGALKLVPLALNADQTTESMKALGAQMLAMVPGFNAQADGASLDTAAITQLRGAAVAMGATVQATTPLLQNVGAAAVAASSQIGNTGGGLTYATSLAGAALSKLASAAPATASGVSSVGTAAVNSSLGVDTFWRSTQQLEVQQEGAADAASILAISIQGLGAQASDATSPVDDFNSSVQDSGVYADSAQGALQTLASNYATAGNAAATAAGQIDQFNGAVSQSSSGGKGGNSAEGQLEALGLAAENPGSLTSFFTDFAPGPGGGNTGATSDVTGAYGGGGIDTQISGGEQYEEQLAAPVIAAFKAQEQAFEQAFQQAASSLGTTTSSANKLSYALTGGSLAPSLDTTTEAATGADNALGTFSGSLNTAANNARSATTSINARSEVAGDPFVGPGGLTDNSAQSLADFNALTGTESISVTPVSITQGQTGDTSTTTVGTAGTPAYDTSGNLASGTTTSTSTATPQEQAASDIAALTDWLNNNLISQSDFSNFERSVETALATGGAIPTSFTGSSPSTAGVTTTPVSTQGPTPGASSDYSSSAPSGTQVSATQVDTAQGDWYYSASGPNGPGWYLQSAQATTSTITSGAATFGGAVPSNPNFSASAPQGTAVGGSVLDTATGQQVQSQIDTAIGDYFYSNSGPNGPGYTLQGGESSSGVSTGNIGGTPAPTVPAGETVAALAQMYQQGSISFLQYQQMAAQLSTPDTSSSVYGSGPPVGGSPSGGGNTSNFAPTVNITGMTPSNAQTVIGQMVTSLRQLGSKI